MPWKYRKGPSRRLLKQELKDRLKGDVTLFASGRESLLALLRAMEVKPGEEVIVQGYTCVVVPNAIHAAGGVVKYADINPSTLNLTRESVEPLVTNRTRAIICQHTFGIPADTEGLKDLCTEKGIALIEDMAHIIPDEKGPESVGRRGDYLILSFGRDKAISGITGGAVISRHRRISEKLQEAERTAPHLPFWHIVKLLEYPSRMYSWIRPLAGTIFLKPAIAILNLLGTLVPIVSEEEKKGHMSPVLRKMPNACAALALYSLKILPRSNARRRALANFFRRRAIEKSWPVPTGIAADLPLQKFPLFIPKAEEIRKVLRKENIHLDDGWTGCVLCPESVDPFDAGYEWGSDPVAESASAQILNLPTHPTMTLFEAEMLARRIDTLLKTT